LLTTAVAVITAVLAGVLAVNLVRQSNERSARQALSQLADAAVTTSEAGVSPQAGQNRARQTLRALRVEFASIGASGVVVGNSQLARSALTAPEISAVLAGSQVSAKRVVSGQGVLVEARRTSAGAIVLVQRRADALAIGDRAIRRMVIALAIAVVIAALLGWLFAARLAAPLKRTAAAARALARGHRNVTVTSDGPYEIAAVGEAINSLASALAHSEARQRDFLLSVSHDLRTPLTAISGFAESLADGVVTGTDTRRVGAVMLAESHRLDRLVADLLDLARLDAQEFRVDLTTVDVRGIIEAAGQVWGARCAAVGVRFSVELPPDPAIVTTDPNRLRQALDGLLENALRVTPSGAPIVLSARAERSPSGQPVVVAEARDGGPGLTAADLADAFGRSVLYDRYRGVRQVGTGLGLAIVHGLITRLGGTVEAGHAAEGGARFTVRLPAVDSRTV
jgi:two-component system sensor histidine kinase BaeS